MNIYVKAPAIELALFKKKKNRHFKTKKKNQKPKNLKEKSFYMGVI